MNLEELRQTFYFSLFSSDELMESLVLKGGSAINSFYDQGGSRVSLDIDFSMEEQFEDLNKTRDIFEKVLSEGFADKAIHVFDVTLIDTPSPLSAELEDFWGGYTLSFKIISLDRKDNEIEEKRKRAIMINGKGKFKVDISKFEYVDYAEEQALDEKGIFTIKVYTPAMIICEKIRAICQQLPEYGPIVKRTKKPGKARARDFYDIHLLVKKFNFKINEHLDLLNKFFEIKRVPIEFLKKLKTPEVKAFHENGYNSLKDTVIDDSLKEFTFYYDFLIDIISSVEEHY